MRLRWPWDLQILGVARTNKRRLRSMAALPVRSITRARAFEVELSRAGKPSYADLALESGVTRVEVCRYVALTRRLPPVHTALRGEQVPLPHELPAPAVAAALLCSAASISPRRSRPPRSPGRARAQATDGAQAPRGSISRRPGIQITTGIGEDLSNSSTCGTNGSRFNRTLRAADMD